MQVRPQCSPKETKGMDSAELRENYLIESLFARGEARMTFSHIDRTIVGGIMPLDTPIKLWSAKPIGHDTFLAAREAGAMNIGGKGRVVVDGEVFDLEAKDLIYLSMGCQDVRFESLDPENPARFYLVSSPAHAAIPTRVVRHADAKRIEIGKGSNRRVVFQYVNPDVAPSCQLSMGMTMVEDGGAWNTWPCHTHERRSEVYFYWNMAEDSLVMHFMGEPTETRHIVVRDEQAVLCPAWSIHTGCGTGPYAFIWSMAGDNKDYADMDHCDLKTFR
ncbi:5-dehydro-4-deoxy-D-glucuronate isomerase [Rhodobacteraceae bacterium RKSG542]|uniref:5-dehydro-4-deoxy-D-glucuronate isomerase n=1 Tax=Pseudovibrio flavus TaxID=2529854 RepID=UPI0012BC66BA|nr:5-dehydro-4-deoxy-D-glucuronate isomerase [Pseudovibrio flavus]MTI16036.1 5-dehydro-4-deoxy-D-glucuronate isomerase [Pseudovibrio flavus]